jgi:hypothetical protein
VDGLKHLSPTVSEFEVFKFYRIGIADHSDFAAMPLAEVLPGKGKWASAPARTLPLPMHVVSQRNTGAYSSSGLIHRIM